MGRGAAGPRATPPHLCPAYIPRRPRSPAGHHGPAGLRHPGVPGGEALAPSRLAMPLSRAHGPAWQSGSRTERSRMGHGDRHTYPRGPPHVPAAVSTQGLAPAALRAHAPMHTPTRARPCPRTRSCLCLCSPVRAPRRVRALARARHRVWTRSPVWGHLRLFACARSPACVCSPGCTDMRVPVFHPAAARLHAPVRAHTCTRAVLPCARPRSHPSLYTRVAHGPTPSTFRGSPAAGPLHALAPARARPRPPTRVPALSSTRAPARARAPRPRADAPAGATRRPGPARRWPPHRGAGKACGQRGDGAVTSHPGRARLKQGAPPAPPGARSAADAPRCPPGSAATAAGARTHAAPHRCHRRSSVSDAAAVSARDSTATATRAPSPLRVALRRGAGTAACPGAAPQSCAQRTRCPPPRPRCPQCRGELGPGSHRQPRCH